MAICPTCLTKQSDGVSKCPADGAALVPEETFSHVDQDLAAGTLVGEYRIEAKIGVGGFGTVYRAVHPVIGKAAAVKVLGRHLSGNAAMISRFIAEARAVNQIRHRNIIDIFAFGMLEDGLQYYVMELLEGMPLDRYLDEHRRLSIEQAMPILRGLARALDAAHAKGILHRDLKPENVFLVFDDDGRIQPKLLDFGLVKLTIDDQPNHKTKTGTPLGTPYYMSPEQCRGLDVDRRTDVYAFGALVFQVLTGEVPFNGGSAMDVLVKHMTEEPPTASERCPDVPAALDLPLKMMLAKEPDDRPPSVGEALDLLARAAPGSLGLLERAQPLAAPFAPADVAAPGESRRALETVPTMIDADGPPASAHVRVMPVGSPGQTFLGAEADVPATKPRSRRIAALVAVALALVVGAVAVAATRRPSNGEHDDKTSARAPLSADTIAADAPRTAGSASVHLRVEEAPEGAIVSADGKELGAAPGPFELTRGVQTRLTISASGYKAKEMELTPTSDVVVQVALEKASLPSAAPKGGKPRSAPKTGKAADIHSDLEGFDQK